MPVHVGALVVAAVLAASAGPAREPSRVVLQGVDPYRVYEPWCAGLQVILAYRGEKYSPAYVQGISGEAFWIGGPCPCAPTCECPTDPERLAKLMGYQAEWVRVKGSGDEAKRQAREILQRAKREIRANRPVLYWHAFTNYEWDVACGFDEEKKELYGRGTYAGLGADYASAPEDRAAGCDIPLGAIFIGDKTGTLDERAAEIGALKLAVLHANGAARSSDMPGGLACYDSWIREYRDRVPGAKPADFPGASRYPLMILHGTHGTRAAASEFMRELAPKYPEARVHLEMAAEHFAREAEALTRCAELAVRQDKAGEAKDPDLGLRAAAHLSAARAMYALAIDEVARALKRIGIEEARARGG